MSAAASDGADVLTASVLLVVGGEAVQRHVWQHERHAYWSAAFEVILEKHGLLDFDRADEQVLADAAAVARYDALIVGWLPEAFWRDDYVANLAAFPGPVFFEGPFDHPGVRRLLGIVPGGQGTLERGRLCLRDPSWRSWLDGRFRATLKGATQSIEIAPKAVATKFIEPDLAALRAAVDLTHPRAAARNLAIAGAISLRRRFDRDGRFFADPRRDAAAALTCVFAAMRAGAGSFRDEFLDFVRRMITAISVAGAGDDVALLQRHAATLFAALAGRSPDESADRLWRSVPQLIAAEKLMAALQAAPAVLDSDQLPALLEGLGIVRILLVAAAFDRAGERGSALSLLRVCLTQAYDREQGAIRQARAENGRLACAATYANDPWLVFALYCLSDGQATDDGAGAARRSYSDDWAERWAASPLRIGTYRPTGGAGDRAVFQHDGERLAGMFENGRFFGCSFSLLAWLTHQHTMHPLAQPFFDCPPEQALAVEALFFYAVERWLVGAGLDMLRVHAWPWDYRYCLTLRCDVDRRPTVGQHDELLAWQREQALSASWYWIADRLDPSLIAAEERQGDEIGLHAMRWRDKAQEARAVETALSCQDGVAGESWHVGGSDYWLGWPSVDAAQRAGFAYTEFVPTVFDLPYAGFPVVAEDGEVAIAGACVGLTHNASPEAIAGRTRKADLISRPAVMREWAANGGHICILHHPDGDLDRLAQWVGQLTSAGRLAWSNGRVAAWWRKTHRRAALRIVRQRDPAGRAAWQITAEEDISDLELRLPGAATRADSVVCDDGERPQVAVSDDGEGLRIRLSLAAGVTRRLRVL